jgi:hypothetical protein
MAQASPRGNDAGDDLRRPGRPLRAVELSIPRPQPGQLLLRVRAWFLALAPRIPVQTTVTGYPLEGADSALEDRRGGRFTGAAVIVAE